MASADSFITTVKSSTVATNAKANLNLGSEINSINKKNNSVDVGSLSKPVPESGLSSVQRPVVAPGDPNTGNLAGKNNRENIRFAYEKGPKKLPPAKLNRKEDETSTKFGKEERSNDQFVLGFNNKGASFSPFGNGFRT